MGVESDDDMFADLERTLCDGLLTMRFDQSYGGSDYSEVDVSCLENVDDLSTINGPAVRSYNLYKAMKAYQRKDYLDSIFFETFAMSLFMRIKFHANNVMEKEHNMPTEDNLADVLTQRREEQPEIIDYLDRFLDDRSLKPTRLLNIEFKDGTELMGLCRQLPTEWTVIQLCKGVNTEVFRQTRQETLRHPEVIFLTLFCYPMSERFDHRPIKIALNQKDLDEWYESSHNLARKLEEVSYDFVRSFTTAQFNETIVGKLKKLLGPWIVCFSGKSRSPSNDSELIARLDQFLAKTEHRFSKRQKMLITLIARRVYLLTKENIKDGALYISKTKYEFWDLMDFFEDLKLACKGDPATTYPVILVVDEHIDFMFWEMCNVEQEFTRVDSMVALLKLYFHHQDNMSEGYFNVKGKQASAVLNPDETLPHFKTLVHPFIKILPSIKCTYLIEQKPKFSDIKSMLANSDVYVYCGHGSGVQYISTYETCQLATNAVVFLMGCSSVALRSEYSYCLATGAHHYYHFAKSPAVIGHLTLTYTNVATISLTALLGKWFSNVTSLSDNLFPADSQRIFKNVKESILGTDAIQYSPYLSNVISQIRKKCSSPICSRAILCHRGLPVRMG